MRIAVGLSGGVDSSVAALLLRRAGHDVFTLFLRNGVEVEPGGPVRSCCSASDARDARAVAAALGVPFHAVDFSPEFRELRRHFLESYRSGRTPNPCARCNRDIKFGRLYEIARALGADAVATGHYARLDAPGGRPRLRRAVDRRKDQSYQLFCVRRERLERVRFPLGDLAKEAVRAAAREAGLPVADKPESQDVCFVPSGDYRNLLSEEGVGPRPGEIVDTEGKVLGRHGGVEGFTVGQRRGLGVRGPRYVVSLRPETSTVVVGTREEASTHRFLAVATNWIGRGAPDEGEAIDVLVQVRSRHAPVRGKVLRRGEAEVEVELERPEPAVAPGQAAVFYDDDEVLGGGWIVRDE
jgi:tRNA-specific 2-thiouridylase